MGWRDWFRRKPSETDVAIAVLYEVIKDHLDSGGSVEDFMSVTVIEPVHWIQKRQTWAVETEAEVEAGRRVTLLSGRGGRLEDAVAVEELGIGSVGGRNLWTITFEHPALETGDWYRAVVDGKYNNAGKEV